MTTDNVKIFPLYIVITVSIVLIFINYAVFHFFAFIDDNNFADIFLNRFSYFRGEYSNASSDIYYILLINLLSFILIPLFNLTNKYFPCSFFANKYVFYILIISFLLFYILNYIYFTNSMNVNSSFPFTLLVLYIFPFIIYALYKIRYYNHFYNIKHYSLKFNLLTLLIHIAAIILSFIIFLVVLSTVVITGFMS